MRYIAMQESGDPSVLKIAEGLAPSCGEGELLIDVAAAGVNRPDLMQRMGLYPAPEGASPILGLEVAGTVAKVGAGVSHWQRGDRVCALVNGGGYAEQVSVAAGQCLPVPDRLSMIEAAALPETFFTVWCNVFQRAQLQAGENFLVHGGSSGIGVAAIQMARAMGAKVYATAGSAEKCAACARLGAELAVNYKQEDFLPRFQTATGGRGMDVILDMVGGDYVEKNLQLAALDGRITNIAFQQGFKTEVNFLPLLMKRLKLMASTLRPLSPSAKAEIAQGLREHIWPHVNSGAINAVIHQVFPLADAAAAHHLLEGGEHVGKIVLDLAVK